MNIRETYPNEYQWEIYTNLGWQAVSIDEVYAYLDGHHDRKARMIKVTQMMESYHDDH